MVGKGQANHNSRKFQAKNTDAKRSDLNVECCNENIQDIYHELDDEALARYNEKEKRSDLRIEDYYEKSYPAGRKKRSMRLFCGQALTEDGQFAVKILDEYMSGFKEWNPTRRVFLHIYTWMKQHHICIQILCYLQQGASGDWIKGYR